MKLLADVNVEKPIIDYLVGIALDVLWIPDYNIMLPDAELLNNEIYSIKGFEMTERTLY